MENTNIIFLQLKAYNNAPSISLSQNSQILELMALESNGYTKKLLLLTLDNEKTVSISSRLRKKGSISSLLLKINLSKMIAIERSIDICYNMDGA